MPAPTLHDTAYRAQIVKRVQALTPQTKGRWGKMSVDQMLCHLSEAMASAIGEKESPSQRAPLPKSVMKFAVLNLPWGKGAPTPKPFLVKDRQDYEEQRARCLRLIEAVAARPLDAEWPPHPTF